MKQCQGRPNTVLAVQLTPGVGNTWKQICGSSSAESLGGEEKAEKAEGGFPGMDCNCSASSLAASAKYAGFMPFVLPVYATTPLSCAQMLVQARILCKGGC